MPAETPPTRSGPPVAVIDIGASAVRLVVAQLAPGSPAEVLEEASRGLLLGKDTFSSGRIGSATMEAAIRALEGFRHIMDGYGVSQVRAVATSAVREAVNADTFLDRVRVRTGLDIDIIDGSEESRYTYLAIRERLSGHPAADAAHALLVEVGGGSVELTRLDRMLPTQSGVYALGAIRLRQRLASWHGRHEQRIRLLSRHIAFGVSDIARQIQLEDVTVLIALGRDIRFAAEQLVESDEQDIPEISREALVSFCAQVLAFDEEGLVERFRLSQVDAETLVPAMLVYRDLLLATGATSVLVPDVSLRAGMLVDLARADTAADPVDFGAQVLASARTLGEKYEYDAAHAAVVARLATQLFDALTAQHALSARDRLILEVAALLHDIGAFVGLRAHHKHSLYLLEATELFGLSRDDMKLVANVARYHRRGAPDKTHVSYMSLSRDDRVRVNKLSAILRVANALDAEHVQKVRDVALVTDDGGWVLTVDGVGDLTMECLVASARADLLTDVFGKRVVVRTTGVES